MLSQADFQRDNPFRPLDWRWRRAQHLVDTGGNYCRHRDDRVTGRAVEYLRALARCTTDRRTAKLRQRMADIAQAHRLHVDGGVASCIVQAWILARRSTVETAGRAFLDVDEIATYEALFFDVRDRLNAKYFIHLQALGGSAAGKTCQQRNATALKLIAYYGGPSVLDAVEPVLFQESGLTANTGGERVNSLHAGKVRLLADLLALPDDSNSTLRLRMIADLTKPTQLDGAVSESPFAAVTEQFLKETRLELQESDLGEAAPEPLEAVDTTTDVGAREAA